MNLHSIQNCERLKAIAGRIALLCLTCLLFSNDAARAAADDSFERGVEFSRSGQFPEASAEFQQLAKTRPAVGTLVNLGLAEWQRGRAGTAILAWEQARWLAPYDARAKENLDFAREVAQVDAPQLQWHETVSTWLPANAWMWLACGTFWLTVALLVLPRVFRWRKTGWPQWLAALSFGVFLFSIAGNYGIVSRAHIGFVLKKNAPLLLTPTREGEAVSTLAAGEPARELRMRGNFVFIRTLNGSGWVEQGEFGLLCPR